MVNTNPGGTRAEASGRVAGPPQTTAETGLRRRLPAYPRSQRVRDWTAWCIGTHGVVLAPVPVRQQGPNVLLTGVAAGTGDALTRPREERLMFPSRSHPRAVR